MVDRKQKRIEWVDIARGIAIICMVAGHTSIPEVLSKYIWSFHMPLFFVVSGLFFNPDKLGSFKVFIKRRLRTLIIPYWFFTFIVITGYLGTEYFKPIQIIEGWTGYALWFVPVLFCAELVFYPISKLKREWLTLTVIFLTAIGYILSESHIRLYFKLDVVPFAIFFIAFGYLFKNSIFNTKPNLLIATSIGLITIVLSIFLPKLDMAKNDFGWIILNLSNALLGIYFIFSVSKYLSLANKIWPIRFIDYFGRNSLFVMAFSQLFNYWIIVGLSILGIGSFFGLCLRYIILFSAIYIAANLLTHYTPALVGKINRTHANDTK